MVERFHRQLKDALRARLVNQDWLSQLPWVLLGLQAAPKEYCGLSFAEMVYGEPLVLQYLGCFSAPPHLQLISWSSCGRTWGGSCPRQ
jgi:hypothetical protein